MYTREVRDYARNVSHSRTAHLSLVSSCPDEQYLGLVFFIAQSKRAIIVTYSSKWVIMQTKRWHEVIIGRGAETPPKYKRDTK